MLGSRLALLGRHVLYAHVVRITVGPRFVGLVRADHRMVGALEVLGGVTVGGVVAAPDVTAGEAQPQVDPDVPRREALLAPRPARFHPGASGGFFEMLTGVLHER